MRAVLFLLACLISVNCLTLTEISKFGTSGNFPEARVTVDTTASDWYAIQASGIPDHATQSVNPNTAVNQNYNIRIPKVATENTGLHGCLPMGMIGMTRTGVAIFNPLTAESLNAVQGDAQETFDSCDGHPDPMGVYHYHKIPDSCLYKRQKDEFIGVALDGFPIYGPNASDVGHLLTSADLDDCHGRVINGSYRYHATTTWPYFMGCFKGSVLENLRNLAYKCDVTKDSGWENDWIYYLCHCSNTNVGGVPTGEQCRPDNPQRPPNCPGNDGNVTIFTYQCFIVLIFTVFVIRML